MSTVLVTNTRDKYNMVNYINDSLLQLDSAVSFGKNNSAIVIENIRAEQWLFGRNKDKKWLITFLV